MTTMRAMPIKCAVCGAETECNVLMSTNSFGFPDLDLRSPGMERLTMSLWVQECPQCGYVSSHLENPTSINREWLSRPEYTSCLGRAFVSGLAARFYKAYLISVEDGRTKDAYNAALHAAWACDDANDIENAKHCRMAALAKIDGLMVGGGFNETLFFQKMDLLRRSGQFSKLIEEFETRLLARNELRLIRDFQIEKAKQCDTECYTTASVPGLIL